MKAASVLSSIVAMLALGACGIGHSETPSSPLPSADLTVGDLDDHGSFFLGPGQTLLVKLPNAASHTPSVLAVSGHYPDATLFKAVAVGRTTVIADLVTNCQSECNARAPFQIAVVVAGTQELQDGVAVSELDQPWIIHVRRGQRFILTVTNLSGQPAWANLTSANAAVIVPEQPATQTSNGIRGQFRAGQTGRTGVTATGGPAGPSENFTLVVFA